MDYKFWSTLIINVAGLGFMYWQVRIMKQQLASMPSTRSAKRLSVEKQLTRRLYFPVFAMAGLVLLSWLPYVISNKAEIAPSPLQTWGLVPPRSLFIVADTSGLSKYARD